MSFDIGAAFTIDHLEGGWIETNKPTDPGGDTYAGITKHEWVAVEGPAIWPPSQQEALDFYRKWYWLKASCEQCPEPLDSVLFQLAVNIGPSNAIRALHASLGMRSTSFSFGPLTHAVLTQWIVRDRTVELCGRLCTAQRQHYLDRLAENNPNVIGLLARATFVESAAQTNDLITTEAG